MNKTARSKNKPARLKHKLRKKLTNKKSYIGGFNPFKSVGNSLGKLGQFTKNRVSNVGKITRKSLGKVGSLMGKTHK
jgi:hypothetical protein